MAETEDTQRQIAAMRAQLDNVERLTRLSTASNPGIQQHVEAVLKARAKAPDAYLLLEDGGKTQDELKEAMKLDQSYVSRILRHLFDNGLIEKMPGEGRTIRWCWHDWEQTLGISKIARKIVARRKTKTD